MSWMMKKIPYNFFIYYVLVMKIKQIGVMGSAADLNYPKDIENIAFLLWEKLAKNGYTLIYGAEKDYDSLSTAAARWAKSGWWTTVGVTYGKTPDIRWAMQEYTDVIVCTGMERWWGREYVLVSSCDAIIAIGGGSWTLNEITIAYQKKIPIVVMKWTWWWSDKLADSYLDERYLTDTKRFPCTWCTTIDEAVNYLNTLQS
jgi:hypothetical protein